MKNIVWLASWYPNELDALTGDFIKRHAQACSIFQPVHVMHVKKYMAGTKDASKTTVLADASYPQLTEIIRYYSIPPILVLGRVYSFFYSLWLYHTLVNNYIKLHGKPHFLHVHVMLRCGLVALYYKWVHKIPYIVTEHYAGYMPGAKGYAKGINWLSYLPLKCIIGQAHLLVPVSASLGNALQAKFNIKKITVIPNVVNTQIFYPAQGVAKSHSPVFLHISTLAPQKNPEQMLEAFAIFKKQYNCPFYLWIVGPVKPPFKALVTRLEMEEEVVWMEETSQQNIATLMRAATALVLYSRFESFGCVNIEAMACGLPVIASDIPVFKEYLQQGITCMFAPSGSPTQLAEVLYNFLISKSSFNADDIAAKAQHFNYYAIGSQLAGVYLQSSISKNILLKNQKHNYKKQRKEI